MVHAIVGNEVKDSRWHSDCMDEVGAVAVGPSEVLGLEKVTVLRPTTALLMPA